MFHAPRRLSLANPVLPISTTPPSPKAAERAHGPHPFQRHPCADHLCFPETPNPPWPSDASPECLSTPRPSRLTSDRTRHGPVRESSSLRCPSPPPICSATSIPPPVTGPNHSADRAHPSAPLVRSSDGCKLISRSSTTPPATPPLCTTAAAARLATSRPRAPAGLRVSAAKEPPSLAR